MKLLTKINQYTYISIIKKYPKGIINRHQHFDQMVKSWNDPNIKTYYQYYYNQEVKTHQIFLPNSDAAKHDLALAAVRFRPNMFQVIEKTTIDQQYYADDNNLQTDISQMRISTFIKECFKKQTRTPTHKFFVVCCITVVLFCYSFFKATNPSEYDQPIVQAQPHQQFYHYDIHSLQKDVQAYIQKINFLNKHSNDVLKQAKQKAFQRLKK